VHNYSSHHLGAVVVNDGELNEEEEVEEELTEVVKFEVEGTPYLKDNEGVLYNRNCPALSQERKSFLLLLVVCNFQKKLFIVGYVKEETNPVNSAKIYKPYPSPNSGFTSLFVSI